MRTRTGCRAPGLDGAAERWFDDDMDALRAAMGSPDVRAALENETNVIDHSGRRAVHHSASVVTG